MDKQKLIEAMSLERQAQHLDRLSAAMCRQRLSVAEFRNAQRRSQKSLLAWFDAYQVLLANERFGRK